MYLNVSYHFSNYCKWICLFALLITGFFQEKFGDDIDIHAGKKKVGTKHADDYSSGVDTDDLANDSDLDVDTCRSNNDTQNSSFLKGPFKLFFLNLQRTKEFSISELR
jgi:hypothetical protein